MSATEPNLSDGLSGLYSPLVQCRNLAGDGTTYQRYEYMGDGVATAGNDIKHTDGDENPLGGFSSTGFEEGAISIKCTSLAHKLPQPGHIIELDRGQGSRFYRVTGEGAAYTRNNLKTASVPVTRLYNPLPQDCLSEAYGQRTIKTQAAGSLSGSFTTALTAINTRTGGSLTYSLGAMPGFTVPGWLTINSTTGALSGTAVAGTWELQIILTETLTNQETRRGFGILSLVIT